MTCYCSAKQRMVPEFKSSLDLRTELWNGFGFLSRCRNSLILADRKGAVTVMAHKLLHQTPVSLHNLPWASIGMCECALTLTAEAERRHESAD